VGAGLVGDAEGGEPVGLVPAPLVEALVDFQHDGADQLLFGAEVLVA
jgi:hypothetical protein